MMARNLEDRMLRAGARVIEPWIPDSLREPGGDPYRRARLAVAFAVVLVAGGSLTALVRIVEGAPAMAVPPLAAIGVGLVGLRRFRRGGSLNALGHVLSGAALGSMATLNLSTGAALPAPLLASTMLPLVSVMILGSRWGAAWGLLSVLQLAIALQLGRSQDAFPFEPSKALLTLGWQLAPPVCVACVLGITLIYESLKSQALRELSRARFEAERASRAKSVFLANTSHELRTPMTGVLGVSELLLATGLNRDQHELVTTLHRSGTQLLGILNDVLDLAKVESGDLELEEVWFDPALLIEDAAGLLTPNARQAGLELEVHGPDRSASEVCGDPTRLRQVILNLVSNAIKFTQQGRVRLELRTTRHRAERAAVTISVEDSGIGIPAERLDSIFDPFIQADPGTQRRYGGTGLGLAISRDLVQKMNGKIRVQSWSGRGSRFDVELELPVRDARPAPEIERPIAAAPHPGARVFLADDDPTSRMVAEQMLGNLGCQVTAVSNGRELLERVDPGAHDLVLLDCQMPELDGYATARALRNMERDRRAPRIPIIALTASGFSEERARCLEAGMDEHLIKPVSGAQLSACLARHLGAGADPAGLSPPVRTPARRPDPPELHPRIDPSALGRLGIGDPDDDDFARLLVDRWHAESAADIERMRTAAEQGDCEEVGRLAHTRKGACANMGATRAAQQLQKLEELARQGRAAELFDELDAYEDELAAAALELTTLVDAGA